MLPSQVDAAFKTHFNSITVMLLPWRQQALGESFKRRAQEETLKALLSIHICHLNLLYEALTTAIADHPSAKQLTVLTTALHKRPGSLR